MKQTEVLQLRVSSQTVSGLEVNLAEQLPEFPLAFLRGTGGLVGWGEAARLEASGAKRFEELAQQWRNLVAESLVTDSVQQPGSGLVAFGSISFAPDSEATSLLVIPEFVLGVRDQTIWFTQISRSDQPQRETSEIISMLGGFAPYRDETGVELKPGLVTGEGFTAAVSEAVSRISSGELEKVVLARDLVGVAPREFDLRPVLGRLSRQYPTCWVYSVDGTFGASPELLVRVAHGQISARVLAGTAGRGTDPGIDQAIGTALSSSHKNIEEHRFAVESLVAALEPFCSHVDADPRPFSLSLPNVWHLASDVYGVLRENISSLDLAGALHPTAAVAGTPRETAQALISELEPLDRGRYAGPVGWIGADGDGEWAIALRGAQVEDGVIRAIAGCGIVAESEPEAELAETELKFQPIRNALNRDSAKPR